MGYDTDMNSIINKSIFNIQPQNKKNILTGYLINEILSVVLIFECNVSKHYVMLNQAQWDILMSEPTFDYILNNISTVHNPKRVKLDTDFYYKINTKSESVNFQIDNKRITLSRDNLLRLKQWFDCINANVMEKTRKLISFQQCFENIFGILKIQIPYLPPSCIRHDFLSSYIRDFELNLDHMNDEDRAFVLELQQIHHSKLAHLLMKSFLEKED